MTRETVDREFNRRIPELSTHARLLTRPPDKEQTSWRRVRSRYLAQNSGFLVISSISALMLSLCDHQRRRTRNTRPTRNRFSLSSLFRTFRDRIPNSTHKIRRHLRGHPSIRIIRFPMLQIDPPCTYLNNDSQRGGTGLSATRLDSLDPAPLSILPVIGRKDGSFFLPFPFFRLFSGPRRLEV